MKYIAFIAEEYSEENFTSGGLKLNFELLNKLRSQGYRIDIFSNKYYYTNNHIISFTWKNKNIFPIESIMYCI